MNVGIDFIKKPMLTNRLTSVFYKTDVNVYHVYTYFAVVSYI